LAIFSPRGDWCEVVVDSWRKDNDGCFMAAPNPADKLYDRATQALDNDKPEQALSLLDQALALDPLFLDALVLKAESLVLLDRWEEAENLLVDSAHAHPDEPALLLAAADLVVDFHTGDAAALEEAYEMAARGEALVDDDKDEPELLTELQRVQGRALAAMGDLLGAVEAFERAYASSNDDQVLVELAMSWFEASRFEEARQALETLKKRLSGEARVHHYLGLLEERAGRLPEAQEYFDRATELDPEEFPKPTKLSEAEFSSIVEAAFEKLPERVKQYLANVPVMIDPIPSAEDIAGDPPLSPLSLGMFRGMPIGEVSVMDPWSQIPSSILLFQRNLERYALDRDELVEEIETTLLHEVGHFVGWDENDLAERGLN
jgi:predicted Zn-dependent protease with MMP-like domain